MQCAIDICGRPIGRFARTQLESKRRGARCSGILATCPAHLIHRLSIIAWIERIPSFASSDEGHRAIGALAPIARCPPPGSVFGGPKGGTACVGAGCNKSQVGTGSGVLSRGARRPVNRPFFFSFCFLGLRVCALWHTNATCRRGANSHKAEMTKRHRNKKTLTTSREGSQFAKGHNPEETPTKRHPHREAKQQRKAAVGCWGRFA